MAGGIYTDQRCPICGGSFKDDGRRGLVCPQHPQQRAARFKVKFSGGITRRFTDYQTAQAFLGGLRAQKGGLTAQPFDPRDYQIKEKPLSFQVLSTKWLEIKKQTVKAKSWANLRNYLARAAAHWGDANIKLIGYGEIEDFLLAQAVSPKTRHNIRSALSDFWSWLIDRDVISLADRPKFPKCPFELGWRKIVDQETQAAILAEVARIAPERVWLGIKWLCDYPAIRPGELLRLREGDILREQGVLVLPSPKEKRPKLVPLFEEDVARLRALPPALPATPFFRHMQGGKGFAAGKPFGDKYLYKWWKRACAALGVEAVDLYGGTRHSSTAAARSALTFEEIKTLTGHSTNQAFERYFHRDLPYVRQVQNKWKGKVVEMKKATEKGGRS